MEKILRNLFARAFKTKAQAISRIKGDGSDREIFRIKGGGKTAIGVVNSDQKENAAFVGFSRHFSKIGLPTPKIYARDESGQTYLEEDLGDQTLFSMLLSERKNEREMGSALGIYRKAARMLPRFQILAGKTLDYSICYPRASFDRQSMLWDLNYFKYYFLTLGQIPFHEQALENDFQSLVRHLLGAKRDFFLYRDFQSRNIMVRDGEPWFIDYQGGRKGALQYDIASLLFDAKADLPPDVRTELLEIYLEAAAKLSPVNRDTFMAYYPGYVYIRIMQAMGAYGLRGFHQKKPHFLQSIPYAVRNIEHILRTSKFPIDAPELLRVIKSLAASSRLRQFGEVKLGLTVRIQSFSYRNGIPADERGHGGGYVFDCRSLPNPGRLPRFAQLNGQDPSVAAFFKKDPVVARFLSHVNNLIGDTVENYKNRNFTDLFVAFGCTGGRHRSVYCAERLAEFLIKKHKIGVQISHEETQSRMLP
ncbi:MAG: RapZ C-terminal domain-containing protein [Elusimicrobiota bacterium]